MIKTKNKNTNPIAKKTTNPTTPKEQTPKSRTGYRVLGTYQMMWLTEDQILNKGSKLIEFLQNNQEANTIGDFLEYEKIPRTTWAEWLNRYPALKELQDDARLILANRREKWIISEEYNKRDTYLSKVHHWYREEYNEKLRDDLSFQAKIKQEDTTKPTAITIHMGNFDEKKEE
jgi:hypothetical protein